MICQIILLHRNINYMISIKILEMDCSVPIRAIMKGCDGCNVTDSLFFCIAQKASMITDIVLRFTCTCTCLFTPMIKVIVYTIFIKLTSEKNSKCYTYFPTSSQKPEYHFI